MKTISYPLPQRKSVKQSPIKWWQKHKFLIRLMNWEYWPAQITNIPVVAFWLYFAAKARHLFFFSAANPAIETGGVLGESKINILDQIPQTYKPQTRYVEAQTPLNTWIQILDESGINYPIILKPNVGERGNGVERIEDQEQLSRYLEKYPIDLILQEYISYPGEYSVLYYRFPDAEGGKITSLCRKEYLSVTGDGERSL